MYMKRNALRSNRWSKIEIGRKARGGPPPTIKMSKMKIDPEMSMKTKDRLTQ